MEELRPETDTETLEPKYTCNLCHVTCEIGPIWAHLIGIKHKNVYVTKKFGINCEDRVELEARAKDIEEEEGRDMSKVKVTICDNKYPMPSAQKIKRINEKADNMIKLSLTDVDAPLHGILANLVSLKKN